MIDFQAIRQQNPIMPIIGGHYKKVANTGGGEYAGSCPFCGDGGKGRKSDRFRIQPNKDGGRWFCRQCQPTWNNDVIDFVAKRDGISKTEAARWLSGGHVPVTVTNIAPPEPTRQATQLPGNDWSRVAHHLQREACNRLQAGLQWLTDNPHSDIVTAPKPAKAWHWLRSKRGLKDDTILYGMLGYNPSPIRQGDIYFPAGVTIPHLVGDQVVNVKVRTKSNAKGQKYLSMSGGVPALFHCDRLLDNEVHTAIVCEGEFDCLLLSQYVPAQVAVVTMGGAKMGAKWQLYFAGIDRLFIAFDRDKTGHDGAREWLEAFPHAEEMPAFLQLGEDITDAWQRGADLGQWVAGVSAGT